MEDLIVIRVERFRLQTSTDKVYSTPEYLYLEYIALVRGFSGRFLLHKGFIASYCD